MHHPSEAASLQIEYGATTKCGSPQSDRCYATKGFSTQQIVSTVRCSPRTAQRRQRQREQPDTDMSQRRTRAGRRSNITLEMKKYLCDELTEDPEITQTAHCCTTNRAPGSDFEPYLRMQINILGRGETGEMGTRSPQKGSDLCLTLIHRNRLSRGSH